MTGRLIITKYSWQRRSRMSSLVGTYFWTSPYSPDGWRLPAAGNSCHWKGYFSSTPSKIKAAGNLNKFSAFCCCCCSRCCCCVRCCRCGCASRWCCCCCGYCCRHLCRRYCCCGCCCYFFCCWCLRCSCCCLSCGCLMTTHASELSRQLPALQPVDNSGQSALVHRL